jgi:hypothetical protein
MGSLEKSLEKNLLELIFHKASINYTNILKGSSKKLFKVCKKADPVAPSTTLWSQLKVTFMTLPGTI